MRWPRQKRAPQHADEAPSLSFEGWGTVTYENTGPLTIPRYHPPGPTYQSPPEPEDPIDEDESRDDSGPA